MSRLLRALAFVSFPVVILAASAAGQEEKKKDGAKSRLPNFWKQLDLSEEQKQKYYEMAGARDRQMDALKQDIAELQNKLAEMKKKLKDFDDGSAYLTVLTKEQKEKLAKLKAESARRTADKAAAKLKELEKSAKTTAKTTKTKKSDKKEDKQTDGKKDESADSKSP